MPRPGMDTPASTMPMTPAVTPMMSELIAPRSRPSRTRGEDSIAAASTDQKIASGAVCPAMGKTIKSPSPASSGQFSIRGFPGASAFAASR